MLIVGMTGCGKTGFMLNMLEKEYKGHFDHIVIICPTLNWNKTYQEWKYLHDRDVVTVPCGHELVEKVLSVASCVYRGSNTLIIIDDCACGQDVKNRVSEVVNLAFSARHYGLSTIVVTQQLTSVAKPYRENISKLVTFYNPNRHDMRSVTDDYLNGVPQEELGKIISEIKNNKYAALVITLRHPFDYNITYSNNAKT
jgi:hypothetical protein